MGLGTGLGLVGLHAGEVVLHLLYLHRDGIAGLEEWEGAGRGGQSVSVITRGKGTSWRVAYEGFIGSGLVGVEVDGQWGNHLIRMSLPFVVT